MVLGTPSPTILTLKPPPTHAHPFQLAKKEEMKIGDKQALELVILKGQ